MNWKKRKRCRKIAHHYGFKYWWEYNRYLKASIRTEHSRYIVDHPNEFHWREILDAYNKICDEFGTPEKKLTENEWWDKVKEYTNEMMIDRDKEFMDLLDEAIRKHRISSKHNIDVIRGHRLTDEEAANMIQDPFGGDFDGDTLAVIPVKPMSDDTKTCVMMKTGEIDHPSDRLPGDENWGYPVQTHVDLAQHPNITTEARIGVSSKGDVKFYGFDISKPCATNNEISTADYDDFHQKLHDQIQKMMDRTSVIHSPTEIPYPLPPFEPDDVDFEKLDWIVPPIPVKLEDECRKEIENGNIENKLD